MQGLEVMRNVEDSIGAVAEQMLMMLDGVASKINSFSQRLAIIESILDRSQ